ncbi:exported hypothetical protein [Verrucomicrobia bacterium]|nr:exported hypothetical protein [Verrucomicrobiota bacterium]
MKPILLPICFLALAFGPAPRAFGQGTAFTYQGSLTDSASPANGNYDLEFYLRDAASGGSPVGTTNAIAPVAVSNGLFTVTLDFGAGVFDGTSRWLEIGVRTNGSLAAYTTLSPRQALTPSPYAIFATVAGGAANGGITSAMLANGSVTSNKVANGAIGTAQLGSNVVTSANIAAGAVGALQISNNAITGQQLANTVALGGTNAFGRLDIYRTQSNTPAISLIGTTTQLRMFGPDAQEKVSLDALPGWGQLTLHNNSLISQQAAVLTANALGGGSLSLNDSNGLTRALIFGADNGGLVQLFRPSGTNTVTLFGNGSQISTYGNDGLERVRLWGPSYGEVLLKNDLPGNQVAVQLSADGSSGGILYLNNTNGSPRAQVSGANNGGLVQLFQASGINTVTLFGNGSQISTYGNDGLERVRLWGPVYGEVLLKNSLAGNQTAVQLTANGSSGGTLYLNDTNGLPRAAMAGNNAGGAFDLYRSDGTATITMTADNGIYALATNDISGSVHGDTVSGTGVNGTSISGIGVNGNSSTGTGLSGTSGSGTGVYASSAAGPALVIGNGVISVAGAGVGTSTTAFIHVATAANTPFGDLSYITNSLCDGNPNAILIATHRGGPTAPINTHVCSVGYFPGGHWGIYSEDGGSIVGDAFNVLTVTP